MTTCCCKGLKFCKYHYSKEYYNQNRDKILEYQKRKYREKKASKSKLIIKRGDFTLTFN